MSLRQLLGVLLVAGTGLAQQPEAMPPPADISKNLETLRSLAPALDTAEEDLAALRADLDKADTENAKADRAERIDAQRERVRQLRENFRIISSGVEDKAYLSEAEEAASPDSQNQLQRIATTEVPEILQRALEPKLVETVGREDLRSVKVEFAAASPSSLDYAILADFSGEVASRANVLERLIHRTCVETCNEHGWVIPFTQVTVHQA